MAARISIDASDFAVQAKFWRKVQRRVEAVNNGEVNLPFVAQPRVVPEGVDIPALQWVDTFEAIEERRNREMVEMVAKNQIPEADIDNGPTPFQMAEETIVEVVIDSILRMP